MGVIVVPVMRLSGVTARLRGGSAAECPAEGERWGGLPKLSHTPVEGAGLLCSSSSTRDPKATLQSTNAAEKMVHGNVLPSISSLMRDNFSASKDRCGESQGPPPLGWSERPPPSHLFPSALGPPGLPGRLPALLHVSGGHRGASEDSSGAPETSNGAGKSDTLAQGGPA